MYSFTSISEKELGKIVYCATLGRHIQHGWPTFPLCVWLATLLSRTQTTVARSATENTRWGSFNNYVDIIVTLF